MLHPVPARVAPQSRLLAVAVSVPPSSVEVRISPAPAWGRMEGRQEGCQRSIVSLQFPVRRPTAVSSRAGGAFFVLELIRGFPSSSLLLLQPMLTGGA